MYYKYVYTCCRFFSKCNMLLKVLSCRPFTLLYIQNSLNSHEPTRLTGISVFALRMIRFSFKLTTNVPRICYLYFTCFELQSTLETAFVHFLTPTRAQGTMNGKLWDSQVHSRPIAPTHTSANHRLPPVQRYIFRRLNLTPKHQCVWKITVGSVVRGREVWD